MTARIDDDPVDLEFSWGDDPPATTRPTIPVEMPAERSWPVRLVLLAVVVVLSATFAVGHLSGTGTGNRIAAEAIAQSEDAQRSASLAASSAAVWQERAEEASDTVISLLAHVESLEQRIAALEATAAEASETIKALTEERDRLKALREQREQSSRTRVAHAAASPASATAEQVKALIRASFPASAVNEAIYIAQHESGLDPLAANGDCLGVFQLAGVHGTRAQRLDATYNVRTAARLWAQSGNNFDRHWYDHTNYPKYRG